MLREMEVLVIYLLPDKCNSERGGCIFKKLLIETAKYQYI